MKKKKYNRFTEPMHLVPITAAEITNPEFKEGYKLGVSGKLVSLDNQSFNWMGGYVAGLKEYDEKLKAKIKEES